MAALADLALLWLTTAYIRTPHIASLTRASFLSTPKVSACASSATALTLAAGTETSKYGFDRVFGMESEQEDVRCTSLRTPSSQCIVFHPSNAPAPLTPLLS